MYDYLHSADLGKSKWLLQPPIDMAQERCDLGGCPEETMTFWTMRIVIDCCRVFAKSEEVAKERYEHLQRLVELYK